MTEVITGLALFFPLVLAVILAVTGRKLGSAVGWVAWLGPLVSFSAVAYLASTGTAGGSAVISWPWSPALNLELSFLLDGLSLFFALVVSGIGILIFFYANFYFDADEPRRARFFASLLFFMAAMLGTVLSNNLLGLFIFWELTGVASFLLIGFDHEKEKSRAGARMALLVTMLTGLIMLVGVVLLSQTTGSLRIDELMKMSIPESARTLWNAAGVLILIGAFGKSAQFPFFFWLPNAMAAPTPVSAYLHSATMVKLGVFLTARMYPILSETDIWYPLLTTIGFGTMLLAAWLALRVTDLKAILAYSTVSQLGFLIGYYGLGAKTGVHFDLVHISSHVLYKACLFMIVGIVDHATGIRDIRQLGGLARRLPWLTLAAAISCASMAGFAGTLGFISKELMLADFFKALDGGEAWLAFGVVILASILKMAFAARVFFHVFTGPENKAVGEHYHAPSFGLQLAPLLLAYGSLAFGLFPGLLAGPVEHLRVAGLQGETESYLALWHGFSRELGVSFGIILLGVGLYLLKNRTGWRQVVPTAFQFDHFFEKGVYGMTGFASGVTRRLHAERPLSFLPIMLGILVLLLGWQLMANPPSWNFLPVHPLRGFVAALIIITALGAVRLPGWTSQLISLSASGFLVTFYFVLYQAPDLALTQILVEAATLLLVLLLLSRFPISADAGEKRDFRNQGRRWLNLTIATGAGGAVFLIALISMAARHPEAMGPRFLEATKPLAKGYNTVNTILIDFRGFDTLGEISVLLIAVLGGIGLLMRYKRTDNEASQGLAGPPGFGIHHEEKEEKL